MALQQATTVSPAATQRATARGVGWIAICFAAAALLALAAIKLQEMNFAPLLLLPLAVGVFLGTCVVFLARSLNVTLSRAMLCAAAVCCALVNVAAQDALAYLSHRRNYAVAFERQPNLALAQTITGDFGPPDFATFWRAQYSRTAPWWIIDALVTTLACAATVLITATRVSTSQHELH